MSLPKAVVKSMERFALFGRPSADSFLVDSAQKMVSAMTTKVTRVVPAIQLAASCAGVLLLSACTSANGSGDSHHGRSSTVTSGHVMHFAGMVDGKFVREGGPLGPGGAEPKELRLSGVIEFSGADGHQVSVKVGKSGVFSVALRPGSYSVSGRSPDILQATGADGSGAGREVPCSQPLSVTVLAGRTSNITVACVVP